MTIQTMNSSFKKSHAFLKLLIDKYSHTKIYDNMKPQLIAAIDEYFDMFPAIKELMQIIGYERVSDVPNPSVNQIPDFSTAENDNEEYITECGLESEFEDAIFNSNIIKFPSNNGTEGVTYLYSALSSLNSSTEPQSAHNFTAPQTKTSTQSQSNNDNKYADMLIESQQQAIKSQQQVIDLMSFILSNNGINISIPNGDLATSKQNNFTPPQANNLQNNNLNNTQNIPQNHLNNPPKGKNKDTVLPQNIPTANHAKSVESEQSESQKVNTPTRSNSPPAYNKKHISNIKDVLSTYKDALKFDSNTLMQYPTYVSNCGSLLWTWYYSRIVEPSENKTGNFKYNVTTFPSTILNFILVYGREVKLGKEDKYRAAVTKWCENVSDGAYHFVPYEIHDIHKKGIKQNDLSAEALIIWEGLCNCGLAKLTNLEDGVRMCRTDIYDIYRDTLDNDLYNDYINTCTDILNTIDDADIL